MTNWPPPPLPAYYCEACHMRHDRCRFCGDPLDVGYNAHGTGRHACRIDALALIGNVTDGEFNRKQSAPPGAEQAPKTAAAPQKERPARPSSKWEIVSE